MVWPVRIEHIDNAERELAVVFPAAFKSEMRIRNGGSVRALGEIWALHPFWDNSDAKRASRTSNDLVRETRTLRELEWFPSGAVVIAVCNTDCLVLLPEEATQPALEDVVYVWYSDTGEVQRAADSVASLFNHRAS